MCSSDLELFSAIDETWQSLKDTFSLSVLMNPIEASKGDGEMGTGAMGVMDQKFGSAAAAYSYLIFVAPYKADKRRKLYKALAKEGLVLESEPLRAWNIQDWLQGKLQSIHKQMDRDAYAYFAGAVSMMQQISLSYLDKEFDKLALFSKAPRITKAELIAVFSGLPEVSVFALLDAISARDGKKALMLLHRQLADGTYFTVLLALLTRHVRQLWQAKVLIEKGVRGRALAKPLELNPFIAEKLGRAAAGFKEPVLKRAMLLLIDADYLLKTGQAGNELLEEAVITLCKN